MNKHIKMTDEEYFAIEAASCSLLKRLDCPAKAKIPFKPTPSMQLGTLVHCAVLEPDSFDVRYVVAPTINKRTKAGKEEWAAFVESNDDKTVITEDEYNLCHMIAQSVKSHPAASDMLCGGDAERVFLWNDESTGERCKSKADYVKGNIIIDLKTAQDSSPAGFARACANFGYHMQDAHYTNGSGCERFIFVVVETSFPFVVSVYELDEEAKAIGKMKVADAMCKYADIRMFGAWNDGYVDKHTIAKLSLPAWVS